MHIKPRLIGGTVALLAAALSIAGAGHAATVYDGTINYQLQNGPEEIDQTTAAPATYSFSEDGISAISTTSSADGGSVYANGTGLETAYGEYYSSEGSALIQYSIDLVGPTGAPVAVDVVADGYLDGVGVDSVGEHLYSGMAFFDLQTDVPVYAMVDSNQGDGRLSFALNRTAYLTPNVSYTVSLYAAAGASDGFGEAGVDPTFTVDPAYASSYSLTGVPTEMTTAIPEPSAWATLILGFGATGVAGRHRRRRICSGRQAA